MKLSLVNLVPLKEVEFDSPAPEGMDIPNFDSLVDALKWKNDLENYSMDLENELKHAQRKFNDLLSGQGEMGAEPEGGPIQQKIAGELNQMKSNIQIFKKELNTVLAKVDYFDQNYLGMNENLNEDKELDKYQQSIAAKWDKESKKLGGGLFDTSRELEKTDTKQFNINVNNKLEFLTDLNNAGKFRKKGGYSDDQIENWTINPSVTGYDIASKMKPTTNEDYKPSHRAYNVIDKSKNDAIVFKELSRDRALEKAHTNPNYMIVATDRLAKEGSCGHGPDGVPGNTPGETQGMDADDRTRGMLRKLIQKEIAKLHEEEGPDHGKTQTSPSGTKFKVWDKDTDMMGNPRGTKRKDKNMQGGPLRKGNVNYRDDETK